MMPSSSARCAQLPRAVDKVPYYLALKKLRDHLRGDLPTLDDSEIVFPALEPKSKSEVKDDASDDDEDSRLSYGDSSAKDMTLEQIQNQAEYLEALIASAEGKDIPMESCGGRNMLNRVDNSADTETSGSGDEMSQVYTPQIHELKPRSGSQPPSVFPASAGSGHTMPGIEIKREAPYEAGEYDSLAVNGPAAQKVSLEDESDPYQYHLSTMPQYISLGDLPNKGTSSKPSYTSIRSNSFHQPTSDPVQHSSTSFNQPSFAQNRIPYPPQGNKLHAQNGSSFQHYHRKGVTSGKDPKGSSFLNIQ